MFFLDVVGMLSLIYRRGGLNGLKFVCFSYMLIMVNGGGGWVGIGWVL